MNAISPEQKHISACAFRDAAIADGWSHEPIYAIEPESQSCRLTRNGWIIQTITRKSNAFYDTSVNVWAPDGMVIVVPETYNFAEMEKMVSFCASCGTHGVKTVRISFAGRCCENCLPSLRQIHEFRGWAD